MSEPVRGWWSRLLCRLNYHKWRVVSEHVIDARTVLMGGLSVLVQPRTFYLHRCDRCEREALFVYPHGPDYHE